MSEALSREAEMTAQAVAEMVVKAATFGKPPAKANRALVKLLRTAERAADECNTLANVYPIRSPAYAPKPRAEVFDAAREARRRVADLLHTAALVELRRLHGEA